MDFQNCTGHNHYLYNGKELQDDQIAGVKLDWYDYGARMYDPALGRWHCIDPSAENYLEWTPYNYCANNPILLVDLDGRDWFYYKAAGDDDASYHWQDGSEYNHEYTYTNENGEEVTETQTLTGAEAVVIFDGFWDESLGTDANGNEGYINGDGAVTAAVTVYGPDGADDISTYTGYTMSSDPSKFPVVAPGEYDGNYDTQGKSGSLLSHWTLNERGNLPCVWWGGSGPLMNPRHTERGNPGYINGVFIHSSNANGYAGTYNNGNNGISEGCLLIAPADWSSFNSQLNLNNAKTRVQNFKVHVNRGYKKTFLEQMK